MKDKVIQMGGKYEVRWKRNRTCPFYDGCEFTNDPTVAYAMYSKAVSDGYTCVDLIMHDWKDCPQNCPDLCMACEKNA